MLFISLLSVIISILLLIKSTKSTIQRVIFISFIFISLFLIVLYFISDMLTNNGFDESVIYHLFMGLQGSALSDFWKVILLGLFVLISIILLCIISYKKMYTNQKDKNYFKLLATLFILLSFVLNPIIDNISVFFTKQNSDFFKHYIYPSKNIKLKNKKNIVYIYAESLEKTYFDDTLFPNLITDLKDIQKHSIDFTNIFQAYNTGWTIAGMTASQCAIPLITPSSINSMNGVKNSFLKNAICLGDILKDNNYTLEYFSGSSIDFAGTKIFYNTHSFDNIFGKEKLKSLLNTKNYLTGWGLYDDALLDIVYKKFKILSNKKQPFLLTLSTMDTHHPSGHSSKTCIDNNIYYKDGSNSMLNAIKCSDYLLAKFINKILNSPYAKNTIIILGSDHYAMPNDIYKTLKKGERKDLLFIIDGEKQQYKQITKLGSTLDISPTILQLLKSNRYNFALGRSLFDNNTTLISSTITPHTKNYIQEHNLSNFQINKLKMVDFNRKLISWREFFLMFWNFSSITIDIHINQLNKTISIDSNKFAYPLSIALDKGSFKPYFTFNSHGRVEDTLGILHTPSYIWIDKCAYMYPHINVKQDTQKECIALGKRNQAYRYIQDINHTAVIPVELIEEIQNNNIDHTKFDKYHYKKIPIYTFKNKPILNYRNHTKPISIKSKKDIEEFLLDTIDDSNKLLIITSSCVNIKSFNYHKLEKKLYTIHSILQDVNSSDLYIGIISSKKAIKEKKSKKDIDIKTKFQNYNIEVNQIGNGLNQSFIKINGLDVSPNQKGLNMVILTLDSGDINTLTIYNQK